MASWKWATAAAAAALSVAPVSAATSGPSIYSMDAVPDWQMPYELVFEVSVPGADIVPQRYSVIPLTEIVGLNKTDDVRGVSLAHIAYFWQGELAHGEWCEMTP